jgi:hypothetical protein
MPRHDLSQPKFEQLLARRRPPTCRRRRLIYRPVLGGYAIVCKNCGEVYGSAESADAKYLAGLNRNSRRIEGGAGARIKKTPPAARQGQGRRLRKE